jgi:hypothetical protein
MRETIINWVNVFEEDFDRVPLKERQTEAMRTLMRWLWYLFESWIKHWLWCWTFLWLYREWKFIDCDLDLDVSCSLDWNSWYKEWEERIMEAFKKSWWKLIRTLHKDWRVFQIAFMSNENVIFDMTFYYTGIKDWFLVSYSDVWIVEEPEHLFNWFIPYPSEEYLEMRYWDWKTPATEFQAWNTYCKSIIQWI